MNALFNQLLKKFQFRTVQHAKIVLLELEMAQKISSLRFHKTQAGNLRGASGYLYR